MNKVIMIGNLVKDIEIRQTQSGKVATSFTLAVARTFKNKEGEYEADFVRCVAFEKTAEILNQYCSKGSKICIDGEIRTGSYDDKDGKKVYTTDIFVNKFEFVGKKEETSDDSMDNFLE